MSIAIDPALVAVAHARLASWIGVDLDRGGVARAVDRHVARRAQALGGPSLAAWTAMLDDARSPEARSLIEAATVPHSWLFRDPAQLEALSARLAARAPGAVSIWVAGCARGEDAYTLAAIAKLAGHAPRVLATDVNEAALGRAREGTFDAWASRDVPARARGLFVQDGSGLRATSELRDAITFARHSVVDAPPPAPEGGGFDVVVCRNVLIYFAHRAALEVVARLTAALAPQGALLLGASDVLVDLPEALVAAPGAQRAILVRATSTSTSTEQIGSPLWPLPSAGDARSRTEPPTRALPQTSALEIDTALDIDLEPTQEAALLRIARDPLDADAQLEAALATFARGDYDEAARRLRAVCFLARGAWAAWLYLGFAYERLGHWDDARRAFRHVRDASGEGDDLPRDGSPFACALHGARARLTRIADDRVLLLTPRGLR